MLWILGIPILLIVFAITVALTKKCVDFLTQDHNKKLLLACTTVILMGIIGNIGYEISRYMPKTFEDILGFKSEEIIEIRYEYGKEEVKVIKDKGIIKSVIQYVDDFTYHLKRDTGISQENLQANAYRLSGPLFISKNNKKTHMDFRGYEMSSWQDYYYIGGGIVEEDKLLQILEGR